MPIQTLITFGMLISLLFFFQAGLTAHCRPQNQEIPMKEYLTIFSFVAAVLLVAYFLIKFCSKIGL